MGNRDGDDVCGTVRFTSGDMTKKRGRAFAKLGVAGVTCSHGSGQLPMIDLHVSAHHPHT